MVKHGFYAQNVFHSTPGHLKCFLTVDPSKEIAPIKYHFLEYYSNSSASVLFEKRKWVGGVGSFLFSPVLWNACQICGKGDAIGQLIYSLLFSSSFITTLIRFCCLLYSSFLINKLKIGTQNKQSPIPLTSVLQKRRLRHLRRKAEWQKVSMRECSE